MTKPYYGRPVKGSSPKVGRGRRVLVSSCQYEFDLVGVGVRFPLRCRNVPIDLPILFGDPQRGEMVQVRHD